MVQTLGEETPHPKTLQVVLEQRTRRNGKKGKEEYRIAKELNTADAWSKYKDIHNKIRKIVRKRKEEQYKRCIEEMEEKRRWRGYLTACQNQEATQKPNFKKQSKWNPVKRGPVHCVYIQDV